MTDGGSWGLVGLLHLCLDVDVLDGSREPVQRATRATATTKTACTGAGERQQASGAWRLSGFACTFISVVAEHRASTVTRSMCSAQHSAGQCDAAAARSGGRAKQDGNLVHRASTLRCLLEGQTTWPRRRLVPQSLPVIGIAALPPHIDVALDLDAHSLCLAAAPPISLHRRCTVPPPTPPCSSDWPPLYLVCSSRAPLSCLAPVKTHAHYRCHCHSQPVTTAATATPAITICRLKQ